MALAVAAGLGMVNAMGRDRGPAAALEQAWIPATTSDAGRTRAFAWYAAVQDAGHALGSLAAGLPALLMVWAAAPEELAYRLSMGLYGLLMGAAVVPYLGARARPAEIPPAPRISPESRRVLTRLCLLFGLDGLGGGFLVTALVSYFIFERFGVGAATIGALFFVGRLANILSHFGAAFLARRIGLVNTMVWSHLPASLLLLVMAWTPSFPLAAALFILREALVEMDVPTRQSYVMAVTRPEERVAASGITNLVRLGTWALGPSLAGWMMQGLALATPLVVGAALKMAYDLLLFAAFRRHRPPEELTAAGEARADRGPVPPPPPAPHPPPDR
jgi:predicted MFS family arabinose efflux permease